MTQRLYILIWCLVILSIFMTGAGIYFYFGLTHTLWFLAALFVLLLAVLILGYLASKNDSWKGPHH